MEHPVLGCLIGYGKLPYLDTGELSRGESGSIPHICFLRVRNRFKSLQVVSVHLLQCVDRPKK